MNKDFYFELFDYIYSVSLRYKKFDSLNLRTIKDIYCEYNKDLSIFVSDINDYKRHERKTRQGSYSFDTNEIKIYSDNIFNYYEPKSVFEFNIELTQVLLHELEHAYQARMHKIKAKDFILNLDDLENYINSYPLTFLELDEFKDKDKFHTYVKMTNHFGLSHVVGQELTDKLKEKYNESYNINPSERTAEIKSLIYIRDMLRKYSDDKRLIAKYKYEVNDAYLTGYNYKKIEECPTYNYIEYIGLKDELFRLKLLQLLFYRKLSFYDRLYLGLPVNPFQLLNMFSSTIKLEEEADSYNDNYELKR